MTASSQHRLCEFGTSNFVPPRQLCQQLAQRRKVSRLSQQLFELAALQSTEQVLHRQRFSLDEVVTDAVQQFELGDGGPGLPGELHQRLDLGLSLRDPPIKRRSSGIGGLGLAIAQRLAVLHGGSLRPLPAPLGARGCAWRCRSRLERRRVPHSGSCYAPSPAGRRLRGPTLLQP